MKFTKTIRVVTYFILAASMSISVAAQSKPMAGITADASEVRWQPSITYARLVLTVSTPEGDVITKEFDAGAAPSFKLTDENGVRLLDGQYKYELRFIPTISDSVKKALSTARAKGNSAEVIRELKRNGQLSTDPIVQSGSFLVQGNQVHVEGSAEPTNKRTNSQEGVEFEAQGRTQGDGVFTRLGKKPKDDITAQDQVIPDDLIVQGSACVGLDCVNNESFGFDTIRLKENNTRIKFDDTSTSAGFPANDWQLTANDSASGGQSKFSIEDITGARVPFTVEAGATTNSIYVDSTGRVGFRTSTPVLDLHVNTSNTPAHRLEQNSTGGFTAQTWDVAGNEANFFIRDVTSGSRLPFRIVPGAPTNSLIIQSDGDVGIGTFSPTEELHVSKNADENVMALVQNSNNTVNAATIIRAQSNTAVGNFITHADAQTLSRFGQTLGGWTEILQTAGNGLAIGTLGATPLVLGTNSANRLLITSAGNIGIGGVAAPTNPLEHTSGARLTAGGVWTDASSRALKTNIRNITASEAMRTLVELSPVKFEYKAQPGESYAGFIAEDVPELVAASDRKSLSSMDIVAVLTKVVQEQQRTIAELKAKVDRLEQSRVKKARLQRKR